MEKDLIHTTLVNKIFSFGIYKKHFQRNHNYLELDVSMHAAIGIRLYECFVLSLNFLNVYFNDACHIRVVVCELL